MRTRAALILAMVFIIGAGAGANTGKKRESSMLHAAKAFIGLLKPDQKAVAILPFNSEERLNWFYIPKERKGLTYKSMEPTQRSAATELLKTSLSVKGFQKVETIRLLE